VSRVVKPKRLVSEVPSSELMALRAELELLKAQAELKDGLPHLYGFPWYDWAKRFFDSTHREVFLTAANQISKSSTQIRKVINWATEPSMWPRLWPNMLSGQKPNQFWYFYPTFEVWQTEFETKWEPEFLPRGKYKDHPQYGWKASFDKGLIRKIEFNSGVTVYAKAYSQKPKDLQTGSVYYLAADEEMPVDLLPELSARLNATDGYFSMVFTATLGQTHWKQVMEPSSRADEKHVGALKLQVSLFDCLKYLDGSLSPWSREKIERAIAKCPNEAEVQRRVYGKFVKSEGLRYEGFTLEKNLADAHPLPRHWHVVTGIDPGTGGLSGHPAAMVFVAVDPSFKSGRVFRAWRGDGVATTSGDILDKYRELKGSLKPMAEKYDYAAKDFFMVASRQGESLSPADKSRDSGAGLLNTLFKNEMLKVQRGDFELEKLVSEIVSLSSTTDKRAAKDDLVDALRYACMSVPWDFSDIEKKHNTPEYVDFALSAEPTERDLRRDMFFGKKEDQDEILAELDEWNELAGS
jgi:hypothetical protein